MPIGYIMELSRREERVLKLLIGNGRMKDAEIGRKLGISSTAARKIRARLERKRAITGYGAHTTYGQLGIRVFVIAFIQPASKVFRSENERLEIEDALRDMSSLISACRIPRGTPSHMVFLGFRTFDDMNQCLNNMRVTEPFSRMEVKYLYTFADTDIFSSRLTFLQAMGRHISSPNSPMLLRELER